METHQLLCQNCGLYHMLNSTIHLVFVGLVVYHTEVLEGLERYKIALECMRSKNQQLAMLFNHCSNLLRHQRVPSRLPLSAVLYQHPRRLHLFL